MSTARSPPRVFLPAPHNVNPQLIPYSQTALSVDFLLPVVKDEEFLAAYSILENPVKAVLIHHLVSSTLAMLATMQWPFFTHPKVLEDKVACETHVLML